MTVKELYEKCKEEIENGFGDNEIILCVNDNDFHSLEGGFSSPIYNDEYIYDYLETEGIDEDDAIILN